MKHNSLKKVWLCIFLLSMYCNAFAFNNNGVTIIDVPSQGNIKNCEIDLSGHDTLPSKPTDGPRHTPSNNISVEVFFHEAYGNIRINIFKDGTKVVYEDGIVASPEELLQYDLTSYGHGSYYICITNGSTVLYDENIEL